MSWYNKRLKILYVNKCNYVMNSWNKYKFTTDIQIKCISLKYSNEKMQQKWEDIRVQMKVNDNKSTYILPK